MLECSRPYTRGLGTSRLTTSSVARPSVKRCLYVKAATLQPDPLRKGLTVEGVPNNQAVAFVDVTTSGVNYAITEAESKVSPAIYQLSKDVDRLATALQAIGKVVKEVNTSLASSKLENANNFGDVKSSITALKIGMASSIAIFLLLMVTGSERLLQALASKAAFPPIS